MQFLSQSEDDLGSTTHDPPDDQPCDLRLHFPLRPSHLTLWWDGEDMLSALERGRSQVTRRCRVERVIEVSQVPGCARLFKTDLLFSIFCLCWYPFCFGPELTSCPTGLALVARFKTQPHRFRSSCMLRTTHGQRRIGSQEAGRTWQRRHHRQG